MQEDLLSFLQLHMMYSNRNTSEEIIREIYYNYFNKLLSEKIKLKGDTFSPA
jgi:hypothetical protein